jgi:hypothetical protein
LVKFFSHFEIQNVDFENIDFEYYEIFGYLIQSPLFLLYIFYFYLLEIEVVENPVVGLFIELEEDFLSFIFLIDIFFLNCFDFVFKFFIFICYTLILIYQIKIIHFNLLNYKNGKRRNDIYYIKKNTNYKKRKIDILGEMNKNIVKKKE